MYSIIRRKREQNSSSEYSKDNINGKISKARLSVRQTGLSLCQGLTDGVYNGKIYQFGTVFYYSKGSSAVFVPVPVIKGVINGKRV